MILTITGLTKEQANFIAISFNDCGDVFESINESLKEIGLPEMKEPKDVEYLDEGTIIHT